MASPHQTGRWAKLSLLAALALAVLGVVLQNDPRLVFVAGLLKAFGEAALVGGLADWFAVRALFTHPFGIPFPHSALIPRNRLRIVSEMRNLVENEWLPRPMLLARVAAFDFVGNLLLPFAAAHRDTLHAVFRTAARNVLTDIAPPHIASFLARAAGRALETEQLAPFLAQAARRARQEEWLQPLAREWLKRLVQWAASDESHAVIYGHLEEAARRYRGQGWFKSFSFGVAEVFGGVDLHSAATLLQNEIRRFAADQGEQGSALQQAIHDGLENVETRLLNDPTFIRGLRGFLVEQSDEGTLPTLFAPMVASVKAEGLRELDRPNSPLLRWVMDRLERWLKQVDGDERTREQLNGWCRQLAATVIDKHHAVIGRLVEDQLSRLSDENLTALIEDRVGDDLNWIRLNGTFVGGLIGIVLYLAFELARRL